LKEAWTQPARCAPATIGWLLKYSLPSLTSVWKPALAMSFSVTPGRMAFSAAAMPAFVIRAAVRMWSSSPADLISRERTTRSDASKNVAPGSARLRPSKTSMLRPDRRVSIPIRLPSSRRSFTRPASAGVTASGSVHLMPRTSSTQPLRRAPGISSSTTCNTGAPSRGSSMPA
jgi:hypothetical protein